MEQLFLIHLVSVIGFVVLWLIKYLLFFSLVLTGVFGLLLCISLLLDLVGIDLMGGEGDIAKLKVILVIINFIFSFMIIRLLFSMLGVKVF